MLGTFQEWLERQHSEVAGQREEESGGRRGQRELNRPGHVGTGKQ